MIDEMRLIPDAVGQKNVDCITERSHQDTHFSSEKCVTTVETVLGM